jgi:hypothetical protein
VRVDLPAEPRVATLACVADGSTSLYHGSGGGIIGAGGDPGVAARSAKLLAAAEAALDELPASESIGVAAPGTVAVVVRTFDGLRRLDLHDTAIGTASEPVGRLLGAVRRCSWQHSRGWAAPAERR